MASSVSQGPVGAALVAVIRHWATSERSEIEIMLMVVVVVVSLALALDWSQYLLNVVWTSLTRTRIAKSVKLN